MEATVEFKDGEKRLICPYNKSHLILHYRMQEHLVKCRRQHKDAEMVICTFNSTHHVAKPELMYHLENCPDKKNLDKYCYTTTPKPTVQLDDFKPTITTTEVPLEGENWDNENQPTYNPQDHCENSMIIRRACIDKQPKSVKRTFRMEQRKKFAEHREETKKTVEPASKPRRPTKASQGIESKVIHADEQSELADWLDKVDIGSKVVTTPKLTLPKQEEAAASGFQSSKEATQEQASALLDHHFPALGAEKSNRGKGSRFAPK